MSLVEIVNQGLTILVIFAQIVVLFIVVSYFFPKRKKDAIMSFFSKRAILFSFFVSLTATMGSLFYSEIAGYTPCKLCWFQRIFMYPQPILFAVALWKKDKGIIKYALTLSVVGGLIALYHYLLQTGIVEGGACSVIGSYSAACSQRFVMEYGYMTIPMMSLTAFAYITALLSTTFVPISKRKQKPAKKK